MTISFDYNWQRMKMLGIVILLVIVFVIWRADNFGFIDGVILIGVVGYSSATTLMIVCRVSLGLELVEVRFLLPFFKGGSYAKSEIKSYTELRNGRSPKSRVFGGQLVTHEGRSMLLLADGMKNFEELSKLLSEMFPSAKELEDSAISQE